MKRSLLTLLAAAIAPLLQAATPQEEVATQGPAARAILEAWEKKDPEKGDRFVHLVYWTPSDREPAPRAPRSSGAALANTMNNMHAFAAGAHSEGLRLKQDNNFPGLVADKLAFLGETNLKNKAAVTRLMRMGKRDAIYTKFGDDLTDDSLLPGARISVLGPPTLAQAKSIARQARTDADEFWHLAGAWGRAAAGGDADNRDLESAVAPLFPDAVVALPKEAEWLVPRINRAYVGGMMSLLRVMDGVLNNTSVILLVQIGETRLLFPGDAQIENWSYALFDAPNSEAIRAELAATNLYKVGHHGSLNATPKSLWNHFAHRNTAEGGQACRTKPNRYTAIAARA